MLQVPGLAVSGKFYVQHVVSSLTSGAGGTLPGVGSRRRLLELPGRSLLQTPANTTAAEASGTANALNAFLTASSGRRKLLQTTGLEIDYACAPCATSASCMSAWCIRL